MPNAHAGSIITSTVYDIAGNPIKITNPDGFAITFQYDEANRAIRAMDQEGNQVFTHRDVDGRPKCSKDPNGNSVFYTYWDKTRDSKLRRVTAPCAHHWCARRRIRLRRQRQRHPDHADRQRWRQQTTVPERHEHPLLRRNYRVATTAIESFVDLLERCLRVMIPGALVYARPRMGKMHAIDFACLHLARERPDVLTVRTSCEHYRTDYEAPFFNAPLPFGVN